MITAQTFFFSSSKNCRNFFSEFCFLMIFLIGKLLFQPPDQGWPTHGPRRNFCGGIQWFFDVLSFAQFFLNASHRPNRVGHPCSRQTSRDFFLFFLVRGVDRWMKKKSKSKFGRITFWTFGHPISHCGIFYLRNLIRNRQLWNQRQFCGINATFCGITDPKFWWISWRESKKFENHWSLKTPAHFFSFIFNQQKFLTFLQTIIRSSFFLFLVFFRRFFFIKFSRNWNFFWMRRKLVEMICGRPRMMSNWSSGMVSRF